MTKIVAIRLSFLTGCAFMSNWYKLRMRLVDRWLVERLARLVGPGGHSVSTNYTNWGFPFEAESDEAAIEAGKVLAADLRARESYFFRQRVTITRLSGPDGYDRETLWSDDDTSDVFAPAPDVSPVGYSFGDAVRIRNFRIGEQV